MVKSPCVAISPSHQKKKKLKSSSLKFILNLIQKASFNFDMSIQGVSEIQAPTLDSFGEQKMKKINKMLLKTINKQSSNCPYTSQESNNNSNWRQAPTNSFSSVNIIPSKPLLWCLTLRTPVCVRLHMIKQIGNQKNQSTR